MICYRLLSDLSIRELKTVFVRTVRRGEFVESSAIIQLTIFLVRIGQDPFTYRFPISVPEDTNSNATVVKDAEVSNFHVQDAIDDVKNVPEFEYPNHSSVMADDVSANVEEIDNRDTESMEAEDNLSEVQQKTGYEDVMASSSPELADGLSTDSWIMLSSESLAVSSSVFLSSSSGIESSSQSLFKSLSTVSSEPSLVLMVVSHRSIKCVCTVGSSGAEMEDEHGVKPLHSDHSPPDLNPVYWVKT